MNRRGNEIEVEALHRVRPRYESEGFRFLIAPEGDEVPDFLHGFQPDAIAKRGREGVVIEVKSTDRVAERSAIVSFLAREVPKHEGWRFDLVLAEREVGDPAALRPISKAELTLEFESALRLVEQGNYKEALPFAWGLLEAATRRLAFNGVQDRATRFLPRTVVERLISKGYLDDETGERLFEIASLRNQIAHGFTRVDVHRGHLETLATVIRKLLDALRN